jgi:hypothetical protein
MRPQRCWLFYNLEREPGEGCRRLRQPGELERLPPFAATVVRNRVFDSFYGELAGNRQVAQVNTYHPVAAAARAADDQVVTPGRNRRCWLPVSCPLADAVLDQLHADEQPFPTNVADDLVAHQAA